MWSKCLQRLHFINAEGLGMGSFASVDPRRDEPGKGFAPADHAMREYVAVMARELAAMARREGDPVLAGVLDGAAELARRPSVTG